jgi:hypothetical protein
MGPATAAKMLDGVEDEPQARAVVFGLYRDYYAGDPTPWQVHVLEQAILLWMRNDALGSVLNVADAGNPLDGAMLGWAEHVSSVYSRIGKSL